MGKKSVHLDWVDILRGVNILLVVMWHVSLVDLSTGKPDIMCYHIQEMFIPFRMPLFMFISGGVLYLGRICKDWQTIDLYVDKAQRLLVPFIVFGVFCCTIKALMNQIVKSPIDISVDYFLKSLTVIYFKGSPTVQLWFLVALSVMMVMFPLYKVLCRNVVAMNVFLLLTVLWYCYNPIELPNVFCLNRVSKFLVFFFLGIYSFKFKLYEYLGNFYALVVGLACYMVSLWYEIDLLCSISVIVMMVSVGIIISKSAPNFLSSWRGYSYQIYLMSLVFQGFVELVLWKSFGRQELFWVFYVLNILFGGLGPVLVAKMVGRSKYAKLRMCFGMK